MTDYQALENQASMGILPKRDVVIVRGSGARLWDSAGKEYIDCIGGIGTANVGHCHPAVTEAITRQAERLVICPDTFYNDLRAELATALTRVAPEGLDRLFLCNSGTEAVEAAFKFARVATGRSGIIAAQRGFHGRTFGALSATWNPKYRAPFEPLVPGFTHVKYNDASAMEESIGDGTAAVILEVVQGEGGVRIGDGAYLKRVADPCAGSAAPCSSWTKCRPDSAGPVPCSPASTMISGRTSSALPRPWPAACPWARRSAPKRSGASPPCPTATPSAAVR